MDGKGIIDPVTANPYHKKGLERSGLGLFDKESTTKKRPLQRVSEKKDDDMFQFMNSLLQQPQQPQQPIINNNKKPSDTRKAVAELQYKLSKAQTEYTRANEAYRRNKGSLMESQFRTKLKNATTTLERLKEQMNDYQSHVKNAKEKQKMYTF